MPGTEKSGIRGTTIQGNILFGTEGQIVLEDDELIVFTNREIDGLKSGEWTTFSFPETVGEDAFLSYIDSFAEAVLEHRSPDFPAEEGRKNLEIILASYWSGKLHEPMGLPLNHKIATLT